MLESNEKKKTAGPDGWFLIILLFQAVFFLWLGLTRRLPAGWDGFQYFHLQYFFLNDTIFSSELPQWLPYLTHGTVATWWTSIQNGLLQSTLIFMSTFAGDLLRGVNFLYLYQGGMLMDELLLILGVWLLSRRIYASQVTAFFLAVTAVGSSVWATQTWHNFHLYYALPLVLFFGHRFLDTGKWRYFLAAANLLTLQIFGNMPYALSVQSLAVFVYFASYVVLNRREVFVRPARIRLNIYAVAAVAVSALTLWAASKTLTLNTETIVNYNYGRTANGESTLEGFLTYGRNLGWKKWVELLFGVSPALDYSLFIGTLPLGMLLLGFFARERRRGLAFFAAAAVLFLFSLGGVLATAMYHAWPMMKFYRHLALTAPLIKLFLILWAGIGFEALVTGKNTSDWFKKILVVVGILLIGIGVFLFSISFDVELSRKILTGLVEPGTYRDDHVQKLRVFIPGLIAFIDEPQLAMRLMITAAFSGAVGIMLILMGLGRGVAPGRALAILLALHTVQIYSYKFMETSAKTISLSAEQMSYTAFQQPPYRARRVERLWFDEPRDKLFLMFKFNPIYWSNNLFLFKDEVGHTFRADHWLRPLDQLMKAYWGQDLDGREMPRGLSVYNYLQFPLTHPASGVTAGLTRDKIQFFTEARVVENDHAAARILSDAPYDGNTLVLANAGADTGVSGKITNEQSFSYRVERFSANRLNVFIDAPQDGYLYYADVWHPRWKVKLGGNEAPVLRANLAYKAVRVPAGTQHVEFYFNDPRYRYLYFVWGILALGWIVYLFVLVFRCVVRGSSAA